MTQQLSNLPPQFDLEKLANLTINGEKVQGVVGRSVLDAATAAGIHIPTLCHHPAVSAHGGCRMCVVEIERQRGLRLARRECGLRLFDLLFGGLP